MGDESNSGTSNIHTYINDYTICIDIHKYLLIYIDMKYTYIYGYKDIRRPPANPRPREHVEQS